VLGEDHLERSTTLQATWRKPEGSEFDVEGFGFRVES